MGVAQEEKSGEEIEFENKQEFKFDFTCRNCLRQFAKSVFGYLKKKSFLTIINRKITPTPLGKAAFASSISPEESERIFMDLAEARSGKNSNGLKLSNDLHILYLITP